MLENITMQLDKICVPRTTYYEDLKNLCHQAVMVKPLIFISAAFILDFIELFSRNFLVVNEKILYKSKYYEFSTKDIYLLITTAKSVCMLMAFVFVLLGSAVWTG